MLVAGAIRSRLIGLIILGFALVGTAHAASERPGADLVYAARYYRPGTQPSHFHLWRITAAGAGRVQVTAGSADDQSPVWLADAKTILFVRETEKRRTLCTVGARGGAVSELAAVPNGYTFIQSAAPDRRSLIYLVHDAGWQLVLVDLAPQQTRTLGPGTTTAWSPDSRRLYVSMWGESNTPAQILDLATGSRRALPGDLRAAAWLDAHTLVAEAFAQDPGQPRLVLLRADGGMEREIPLPFTWEDDQSPFADNLYAIPGDSEAILYGRHAGDSSAGAAQLFSRVSLKSGQPTEVARGRSLAWSPDHQSFITGDGRYLAPLARRRYVWVSPLSLVALRTGEVRPLVQG